MSDHNGYEPELTPGQKLRAAFILFIIGGGVLYLLIKEVFF